MDRKELKCLFLIVVTFIAACVETDIYLPAFPDMMRYFGTSEGAIQGLLTWNFLGICISGPFYGPISDAFGRKKPLMVALAVFLAGSLLTLCAQTFDQMLWGRILQGLGSGGCFTLGTAIIFDSFQKEKAVQAMNQLTTIIPCIMAGAPLLGGYLNNTLGFRSNFVAIALFVFLSFIACLFFFEESLSVDKRIPFRTKTVMNDFKRALLSIPFWQLTVVTSLIFAGYIAFLAAAAVLFVVEFGVSTVALPFYQLAILGSWVAAGLVLNKMIVKWGIPALKKWGMILIGIGGAAFIFSAWLFPQNPIFLTSGMILYAFGGNWIFGLYFPESMEILPDIKGVTASLITSIRLLLSAVIVGFSAAIYNGTIYPVLALIIGTIVLMAPIIVFYEKKRKVSVSPVI
ncbi:MAG: MFS transporter [Chlamydiota bacterium]